MSRCDIIIPIWNQPAFTRRCLESVAAATRAPYRLLLIDNGSEQETRGLLDDAARRDPERVQVLRNAENLGFIKAVNQGIRASTAPYVCLLNNDTVVMPGWLEEMVRVAESDPAIGLVNPQSTTFGSVPAQRTLDGIRAHAEAVARERGQTRELATAIGFCLVITRRLLETIGLFDEQYGMGNFEDADFTKRGLAAGFRAVLALGAYVYHEEKASFKHQRGWEAAFRANQQMFYRQWGRPLRIIWDAPSDVAAEYWTPTLTRLMQAGHWVAYNPEDRAVAPEIRHHNMAGPLPPGRHWPHHLVSALRAVFRMPPLAANQVVEWRRACVWYILKRRKKPVDLVVTHDPGLARTLRWLAACHRATVLLRPTPDEVEQQCRRLSRCP